MYVNLMNSMLLLMCVFYEKCKIILYFTLLKEVAAGLEEARKSKKKKQLTFIKFGPAGSTESSSDRGCQGILATASDWILMANLQTRLVFPPEFAVTRLQPDIVMWSRSTRNLIIIELTVPWQERMEEASERKRKKYQDLVIECKEKDGRFGVGQ